MAALPRVAVGRLRCCLTPGLPAALLAALTLQGTACRGRDRSAAVVDARNGTVAVDAGGNAVTIDSTGVRVAGADGRTVSVSGAGVQVGGAGGATVASGAAAGGTAITINGNDQRREFNCNGGSFVVNGTHNTLTLHGNCAGVTVSGNENTVLADAVGAISTVGNGNRVTYRSGLGGGDPQVSDLGSRNTVVRGG